MAFPKKRLVASGTPQREFRCLMAGESSQKTIRAARGILEPAN
ncbi:hypothetical protein [Novipirellula galeiformis]|nr:hypothetical protein [Novipirellula galeiformis]